MFFFQTKNFFGPNIFSDLIIDSYLVRVAISHEVEVMDWTGPLRFVEEGKSVSRPAVRQTEEEQQPVLTAGDVGTKSSKQDWFCEDYIGLKSFVKFCSTP